MNLIRMIINSKFLPIFIIIFGFFISFLISSFEPQPNKGIELPKPTAVFYEIPVKKDITLTVNTNGEVRSVTEINVIPQVSGRIVEVADEFIDGGNITKNQPLIWIDDRDYKLAVISADSRVAQAKKLLEREIAESELAKKDWEELGEGEASPLTLRIPQLEEARAILNAAEADLEKAKLNLERTVITLPFDGLIKRKNAGIGQYVNAGSVLGSAFSTEKVLIPLPLTDTELSYLGLPLGYEAENFFSGPKVIFKSFISRKNVEWAGRITRISGSIDSQTRLVYAYAEVLNPYDAEPPLAIGTYVDARNKTIELLSEDNTIEEFCYTLLWNEFPEKSYHAIVLYYNELPEQKKEEYHQKYYDDLVTFKITTGNKGMILWDDIENKYKKNIREKYLYSIELD